MSAQEALAQGGVGASRVLAALEARPAADALWTLQGPLDGQALLRRSAEIARALASAPGRCVALQLDNGADWLAADLAVLSAGRVCVPLPKFLGPAQLERVAQAAGIQSWLVEAEEPPLPGPEPWEGRWLGGALWLWTCGAPPIGAAIPPPRTAKIRWSAGSAGQPRGVCLAQDSLECVAGSLAQVAIELGLRRHLCALPLSLLLENVAGAYAPLLAGIPSVVLPLERLGWQPGGSGHELPPLLAALARWQPDSVILMPELLHRLVSALERGAPRPSSLRFAAVSGGRVSAQLFERAAAVGLPVYEGYGLAECGSVVALSRPGRSRWGWVGPALPHARLEVAADGEVIVHGPCMEGYLGQPPHAEPGRWATGDIGRLRGGYLRLSGRKRSAFLSSADRSASPA
jgi:long-chain acyl-CoA synthetase